MGILISCGVRNDGQENKNVPTDPPTKEREWIRDDVYYNIVVIDSCEYIFGTDVWGYNGGYFLSHKGNCKFCKIRENNQ